MSHMTHSLFLKAKRGDIEAYEKLIEPYELKVFSAAFNAVGSRELASHLAQEVFVIIFRSIKYIEDESLLPVWIYKTIRRVCKDNKNESTQPRLTGLEI